MRWTERPKIAFFSFTSCEGCQLMVLNCEEELKDLALRVDVVNFREAMDLKREDYKVAFIEGSITREEEVEKVKEIRQRAEVVITLGACSTTGGINALKNRFSVDYVTELVYGKNPPNMGLVENIPAMPVDRVIEVDYHLPGCPISKEEFLGFVKALTLGIPPRLPEYPVCNECKMEGNICVFETGRTCMGPVTRGGCRAVCVSFGAICWGCRGTFEYANIDAHRETLKNHGLSEEEITEKFDLYNSFYIHGKGGCTKTTT